MYVSIRDALSACLGIDALRACFGLDNKRKIFDDSDDEEFYRFMNEMKARAFRAQYYACC
jgi:hypothetical protein